MSHRTLLAVAGADGYDCREVRRVPANAAVARRLLADSTAGPGRLPNAAAVLDALEYDRHETLALVSPDGSLRRYCVLPGALGTFRSPPRFDGAGGGALVAVADDREDAEFRRLWDGARALAAVAVDEDRVSAAAAGRLLGRALDRLTHERAVIVDLAADDPTSGRL